MLKPRSQSVLDTTNHIFMERPAAYYQTRRERHPEFNEYHLKGWGVAVKSRDTQCQVCGAKAEHAHHLFYKVKYPALAYNLNNGIGLCTDCHNEVHYRGQ
jgi:5-methylcytosine-specific restriction endonuclease McrA